MSTNATQSANKTFNASKIKDFAAIFAFPIMMVLWAVGSYH